MKAAVVTVLKCALTVNALKSPSHIETVSLATVLMFSATSVVPELLTGAESFMLTICHYVEKIGLYVRKSEA